MRLKSTKWFIIMGFICVSFILMGIGFFSHRAPVSVFYVGFALMVLIIPCAEVARFGTSVFFVSLAFFFVLMYLLSDYAIISVPIIHKEYHAPIQRIHEEDDHLTEKNPPYIQHFVEKGNIRHGEYYFNKSSAIFGIDLGEATGAENKFAQRIYPTFRKAVEASGAFDCDVLPSVELIDGFCKYLDDRLVAGIEEHVHSGSSIYPGGMQGFLTALLTKLLQKSQRQGHYSAASFLAASILLGGGEPHVQGKVLDGAQSYIHTFLDTPLYSKPIGFYTKTETLQKIFKRDRFLQKTFAVKPGLFTDRDFSFHSHEGVLPMVRIAEVLLENKELLNGSSMGKSSIIPLLSMN